MRQNHTQYRASRRGSPPISPLVALANIEKIGLAKSVFQQPARDIKARAVVAPLKQPVRTAVQFLLRPSSLIDVLTEQGQPEF